MNTSSSSQATSFPTGMEIIAHRGASVDAPENTVAAYRLAWEQGADAGETDVYLTRDQQVVVLHDGNTKRTTGTDLEVSTATYEQLRHLDAGSWKAPAYVGEPIPLLSYLLSTLPAGRNLYVEIKCGPEVLPLLAEALQVSGKRNQAVIIGFDLKTMTLAKQQMPERTVYWLCSSPKDKESGKILPNDIAWIDQAKAAGIDGLSAQAEGVTESFVQAVHAAGMRLVVWTVNDPALALRLQKMGVDGLTTDAPSLMKKVLHTAASSTPES